MPRSNGLGYHDQPKKNPNITKDIEISGPIFESQVIFPDDKISRVGTTSTNKEIPHSTCYCASKEVLIPVPERTITLSNASLFVFHSALAFITLFLGNVDLSVPLYKSVLDFRVGGEDGREWEIVPVFEEGGSIPFTVLTSVFFILSAFFHLGNALIWRKYYISQLQKCCTPTRWLEYSLSAPVMIVLIAYSLGVRSRSDIVSIAALIGITMPFGYWVEVVGRPSSEEAWSSPLSKRLFPWFLGHIPQTVAWALIILQFYSVFSESDRAPWFVTLILWLELAFFFSFGAASLLSQILPPRSFYKGELLFQFLSLVSKGALGGILIANVLVLSTFEEIYD